MNNNWHKKEKPLLGLTGLGGGVDGLAVVGAAVKTYVDDVFSTYLWKGTGSSLSINNGIDLAGKGGLTWVKDRSTASTQNSLFDTVRGADKVVYSNTNGAEADYNYNQTFTSTGFTFNNNFGDINDSNDNYSSWSFRKVPGFFDVVKYTGGSGTQTISHNLGCVPGMIMVKALDNSDNWAVFHRGMDLTSPNDYGMKLNTDDARFVGAGWNVTATTFDASFSLTNNDGAEFIAYLFAGGESSAATATSVRTESSGYLGLAQSTDFDLGTSDFTIETWARPLAGDRTGNNFYVLSMGYPFLLYYMADGSVPNSGKFVYEGSSTNASMDYMVSGNTGANSVEQNQWNHVAVTRNGSTFRFFLNGELKHTSTSSGTFGTNTVHGLQIGRAGPVGTDYFQGQVSNFRYVLGTALYTDSFKVPTEPLSNVTNTKVLCCQGSATDSATVSPGTITPYNSPTWSADSPFDDPAGFVFGADSDQGIIKTGRYTGNGSSTGPEIEIGWEPQWLMIKRANVAKNWTMFDNMRGIATDGNDAFLYPNLSDAESATGDQLDLTPTGFKIKVSGAILNGSGDTYIFTAIRRPDGYVGKPASAGTDVFAMDYGNASTTIPAFDSNFPVDFGLQRTPTTATDWAAVDRLRGPKELKANTTAAEASGSAYVWDSNVGYTAASWADSNMLSWMWKRCQGMDVVTYEGNLLNPRNVFHSLNAVPEMMWIKRLDSTSDWAVYHKGLNGGTNPEQYWISLNSADAEVDHDGVWKDTAPTSTYFTIGGDGAVGTSGSPYVAMLFSSVTGISKCGYYAGTGSEISVTTGFQPRFIIIKSTSSPGGRNWLVFDTTRGWAAGNDYELNLNKDEATNNWYNFGAPTATGFTASAVNADINASGNNYIYYAHA